MIDDGIEEQREHFDNVSVCPCEDCPPLTTRLQLELHIGYVYGNREIPPHASHYKPRFVPGARLPHCWIRLKQRNLPPVDVSYVNELSAEAIASRQYSTLDLIPPTQFVLIGELEVPGVRTCRPGYDFELLGESGVRWLEQSGLNDGGALLVRPDQHILERFDSFTVSVERVIAGLNRHLGQSV